MRKSKLRRFWEKEEIQSLAVILDWVLEVSVFILLPLIIYLICYGILGLSFNKILFLPEWMFFSIILWGDVCRKLILLYRNYKGFEIKIVRTVAGTILGISLSAIVLTFSIIGNNSDKISLPNYFGVLQVTIFCITFLFAGFINWWITFEYGEFKFHTHMIKDIDINIDITSESKIE